MRHKVIEDSGKRVQVWTESYKIQRNLLVNSAGSEMLCNDGVHVRANRKRLQNTREKSKSVYIKIDHVSFAIKHKAKQDFYPVRLRKPCLLPNNNAVPIRLTVGTHQEHSNYK